MFDARPKVIDDPLVEDDRDEPTARLRAPDDPLTFDTYDVGTAGTVYDAVRTDELDRPNEMPLLLANDSVPDV